MVTTHLYDGKKSLPLDIELYQHGNSLPEGKRRSKVQEKTYLSLRINRYTFPEALEAFRTAISFRFVSWLNQNRDVFIAYKASLGFIWA